MAGPGPHRSPALRWRLRWRAPRCERAGRLTRWPLRCLVAAVSVGAVDERLLLDLNYQEDKNAAVDMNVVMTSSGAFVEVQGAGEEATFSRERARQDDRARGNRDPAVDGEPARIVAIFCR